MCARRGSRGIESLLGKSPIMFRNFESYERYSGDDKNLFIEMYNPENVRV